MTRRGTVIATVGLTNKQGIVATIVNGDWDGCSDVRRVHNGRGREGRGGAAGPKVRA